MANLCAKRDELLLNWNAALNALGDLEDLKTAAIRDADPNFSQWDARIQGGRMFEDLAKREYDRHLAMHGCTESPAWKR